MRTHIGFGIGWALAALVTLVAGCGEPKPATPEACMKAFDAAMRQGKVDRAVKLIALEKWAEDNSTDWQTYAPSQRDLILGKMREEFATKLEAIREAYLQANYQVTSVQVQGEWATLQLTGGGMAIPVTLYSRNGVWQIYSLGNLQVGAG